MKSIILTYTIVTLLNCQNILSQSFTTENSVITKRIILIGDAGEPSLKEKEPVLIALQRMASEIKDSTVVLFLGDNIYPIGLTDESNPDRKEYERRIDEQINAVVNADAKGFFIPGNHDWNRGKSDGIQYVRRQYEYVTEKGGGRVLFKPENGCPGPDYFDFGDNLRLIFLDTQWWLQDNNNSIYETDDCEIMSGEQIVDKLSQLMKDEDKFIVIAAHHPLKTYGKHGGKYSWRTHLFPLTELDKSLYIPLPIIGSVYIMLRNLGISRQDISNPMYAFMINKIESVLQKHSGVVYVSGHDHSLQVIKGINDNLYLVSGAGIYDLVDDYVGLGNETIYADNVPGFFILDFLTDGRIKLTAVKITDREGSTVKTFELFTKKTDY